MTKIILILDRISDWIGNLIAPLTLLMMLFTCIVVAARYLFNTGAIPLQESVTYLHGTVFMLGISYTLQQSGHVRVDILYSKLSKKHQAIIDSSGSILFLFPMAIFIFWTSLDYVQFSWSLKETSIEPGGLPIVYILKTLIPIMAILLFLQGIAEFLRSLNSFFSAHSDK